MKKLVAELFRLYLPAGSTAQLQLEQRMAGQSAVPVPLATPDGGTRVIAFAFLRAPGADPLRHWTQLCALANALQSELGLPAPAVSISALNGYDLWLSFEPTLPAATAREFVALVRAAYCPDAPPRPDTVAALPPYLDAGSGKWSAFINPGLGASFAEEAGLDMAPPLNAQCALLDGLHSITEAQLAHALHVLHAAQGMPEPDGDPPQLGDALDTRDPGGGLLLRDATLEDIVRHLHALHIEPTFRHLIGPR